MISESNLRDLSREIWDVAIIGAGPAGGIAAALLAGHGCHVVLLEKSAWPRHKVCGGCLNATAVQTLRDAGLHDVLRGAVMLHEVAWHVAANSGGRALHVPLPGGAAIGRAELDAALVQMATARGCVFIPGVSAIVQNDDSALEYRTVRLQRQKQTSQLSARIVLVCDGIAGTSLAEHSWARWQVAPRSWIGVSIAGARWPTELTAGMIHMNVGMGGYVGATRLIDGRVCSAAALDVAACKRAGGPAKLVRNILRSTGIESGDELHLRGTLGLTRRRATVANWRCLVVGDACGYVEPYTGEGIAWALQSGRRVAELTMAHAKLPRDLAGRWQAWHHLHIAAQMRTCRRFRAIVHSPVLARLAVIAGRALPSLSAFMARRSSGGRGPVFD